MKLVEVLEETVSAVKVLKEVACRNRPKDIQPQVQVYRGEDLVAIAVGQQNRKQLLDVMRAAIVSFDADAVSLCFESYTHPGQLDAEGNNPARINPMTGQVWRQGEMQEAAEKHRAIEQGWVQEAIMVAAVNRAGDVRESVLPFRFSGKHLVWEPVRRYPSEAEAKGIIPDAMRAAMAEPSMGQWLPYELGDGPRAERDAAAAVLMGEHFSCAVIVVSDEDRADRTRALRRWGRKA